MGEIIELDAKENIIEYIFEGEKIVAVTHPDWPFRIMRRGNEIALVCEETDEPFGQINRDVFNTILMSWLLIDDPELVADAQST